MHEMPKFIAVALVLNLSWAGQHCALAQSRKGDREDPRKEHHILCLHPGDIALAPRGKADKRILDCLLKSSGEGEEGVWQRALRSCLSANGVIETAGCHYDH
jgi:hypothetical protein